MANDKKNRPDHIFIDRKKYDWDEDTITGLQIKNLAGVDVAAYNVWQDVPGPEDIPIADNLSVDLTQPGVEKFFTGKKTSTEG
ncbi:MAG: multiubiquitin domain-containing protein [Pseudomonadota bacterium]|jgi:hypothetical protein